VVGNGSEIIRSDEETGSLPGTILHSGCETESLPLDWPLSRARRLAPRATLTLVRENPP